MQYIHTPAFVLSAHTHAHTQPFLQSLALFKNTINTLFPGLGESQRLSIITWPHHRGSGEQIFITVMYVTTLTMIAYEISYIFHNAVYLEIV